MLKIGAFDSASKLSSSGGLKNQTLEGRCLLLRFYLDSREETVEAPKKCLWNLYLIQSPT